MKQIKSFVVVAFSLVVLTSLAFAGAAGPDLDNNGQGATVRADKSVNTVSGTLSFSGTGALVVGGTTANHTAGQILVTSTSMNVYLTGSTGLRVSGTTVVAF